jgi:hypothetical protein
MRMENFAVWKEIYSESRFTKCVWRCIEGTLYGVRELKNKKETI